MGVHGHFLCLSHHPAVCYYSDHIVFIAAEHIYDFDMFEAQLLKMGNSLTVSDTLEREIHRMTVFVNDHLLRMHSIDV